MGFQQGFRINTNTASLNTYRSYGSAQAGLEKNIERLSSGLRINKAADKAADLAKNQILVQSGTSMLAQASSLSQNVLALIR